MTTCERIMGCPYFNGKVKLTRYITKAHILEYCFGKKNQCARYVVLTKLGAEGVPYDLYPNEMDRAKDIIRLACASQPPQKTEDTEDEAELWEAIDTFLDTHHPKI